MRATGYFPTYLKMSPFLSYVTTSIGIQPWAKLGCHLRKEGGFLNVSHWRFPNIVPTQKIFHLCFCYNIGSQVWAKVRFPFLTTYFSPSMVAKVVTKLESATIFWMEHCCQISSGTHLEIHSLSKNDILL